MEIVFIPMEIAFFPLEIAFFPLEIAFLRNFKKSEANFIDDFIQLGQSNDITFYQISTMRDSVVIEDTDLQIMSIYFRFDSNYDTYYRRIYSIGDLLGQTGGMYSSILLIGAAFVGIFSERLFVSSILRKIYQIDQIRDQEVRNTWHKANKISKIGESEPVHGKAK